MVSNQQSDPYYQDNPNLSNLIKEFRKNKKTTNLSTQNKQIVQENTK